MEPRERLIEARIREATPNDAAAVATVYCSVFPSRRLSRFGAGAVREYFRLALGSPRRIALLAESAEGAPIGLAVGYTGAPPLRSAQTWRFIPSLMWQITRAVVRQPSLLREAMPGLSNQGRAPGTPQDAFLSAIGIIEAGRGQGRGRGLLTAFITKARAAGATRVFLEVEHEAESALALYRSTGFQPAGLGVSSHATMVLFLNDELRHG